MQIASSVRHVPISLNPDFPLNIPYAGRLHMPDAKPAQYMHYHDTLELGLCRRGSGLFYIGGEVHGFSQGDVSVILPGVAHIAQSARNDLSGWQFIDLNPVVLLGPEYAGLCASVQFSGILRAGQDDGLGKMIERIQQELSDNTPFARESARWLVGLAMVSLARRQHAGPTPRQDGLSEVSAAVVYISMHYDEALTVGQLAALCNRSVTGFRRAFERATGRQPFEYIYEVRVKAAMNLLRGGNMAISEIAGRVGYSTLSSFNRHFRRITGLTPSQIRKNASILDGNRV